MIVEVCQTQVAERLMSKDFLFPVVPRSPFTGQADVCALPAGGAGAMDGALPRGLLQGALHPHVAEERLLSHPLERLSQSKAATGHCCCCLQGAGRYCDCLEDKVRASGGKKPLRSCCFILHGRTRFCLEMPLVPAEELGCSGSDVSLT